MHILSSKATPFNPLLNKIDQWSESESFFKRNIITRLTIIVAAPPIAAVSALYNLGSLVVKTPVTLLKYTIFLIPIFKYEGKWRSISSVLPQGFEFTELLLHAYKVFAFVVDFFTAPVIGFIHPKANVWLHDKLGLASIWSPKKLTNKSPLTIELFANLKSVISISESAEGYDKEGNLLPKKGFAKRLHLECTDGNNFDVEILSLKEVDLKRKDIKEKIINNQLVIHAPHPTKQSLHLELKLDVDEVCLRMHLTKQKLIHQVEAATLEQYLISRREKFQNLKQIVEHYSEIFKNYEVSRGSTKSLISKESKADVELTARQMMKVVRSYHYANLNKKPYNLAWKNEKSVFLKFSKKSGMEKMEMLAQKDENGKLIIARLDNKKTLGNGTYGTAYKVMQLTTGRFTALKLATGAYEAQAVKNIQTEAELLAFINKKVSPPCIQSKPHCVFNIASPIKMVGFLGELYDGDAYNLFDEENFPVIKLTPEIKNEACKDILKGSLELEKLGVVSCDNKLENTFFKFRKDKSNKVVGVNLYLADMGGAMILDQLKEPPTGLIYSSFCTPKKDLKAIDDSIRSKDLASYKKNIKALDVFQKGYMLYNLLTKGASPYEQSGKHADTSKPMNMDFLINSGIGPYQRQLISDMLNPDPDKRPGYSELVKAW